MRWFVATAVLKKSIRPNGFQMKIFITHIMLLRLAAAMRRFFKFSHKKNRLKISKCAQPADGLDGKEKISEGDKCEPKGSQKSFDDRSVEYSRQTYQLIQNKIKEHEVLMNLQSKSASYFVFAVSFAICCLGVAAIALAVHRIYY